MREEGESEGYERERLLWAHNDHVRRSALWPCLDSFGDQRRVRADARAHFAFKLLVGTPRRTDSRTERVRACGRGARALRGREDPA